MNYGELKTAILSDSHREDYTAYVARFVQQAESLIAVNLEGYFLETSITESSRSVENVYTLPARVTAMRTVIYDQFPLTQVDETNIGLYRSDAAVHSYCMRGSNIVFAGIPPTDAEFDLFYYGMPAALAADGDTNNLLTDCPQLYIEAAQVYVYRRARNFQASQTAFDNVQFLISEINRKMKKKLGGGQAANPYNVYFRSSY